MKIGFSTDLRKRVRALQTSAPFPLKVHFTFLATRPEERQLHALFAEDRIRVGGERFHFSPFTRNWIDAKRQETSAALSYAGDGA